MSVVKFFVEYKIHKRKLESWYSFMKHSSMTYYIPFNISSGIVTCRYWRLGIKVHTSYFWILKCAFHMIDIYYDHHYGSLFIKVTSLYTLERLVELNRNHFYTLNYRIFLCIRDLLLLNILPLIIMVSCTLE